MDIVFPSDVSILSPSHILLVMILFVSFFRITVFPTCSYYTIWHCLFASSPDSFFFVFFRRYKQIKTATIIRTVAVSVGLLGLEPMVSLRSVTNTSALLLPPLAAQDCGTSTMSTWHKTKNRNHSATVSVGLVGLEPMTSTMSTWRSNQLSYNPIFGLFRAGCAVNV